MLWNLKKVTRSSEKPFSFGIVVTCQPGAGHLPPSCLWIPLGWVSLSFVPGEIEVIGFHLCLSGLKNKKQDRVERVAQPRVPASPTQEYNLILRWEWLIIINCVKLTFF